MIRRTKLIATLGPATDSPEMLAALIGRGVDVFRLNMSHGNHEWVREVVQNIRAAADARNTHCAILMDLQGPSIRTGELPAPIPLKVGDLVEFRVETTPARAEKSTTVNYRDLPKDVSVGDTVVVDNGLLHLRVVEKDEDRLLCSVLTEGMLTSRRHINLPGVRLNLPAMTAKDREDATLAAELQIDFLALSFVRDVAHVEEARAFLAERRHSPRIVAKIEDQEAVKNINGIIQATDVIMVARGDLGIEVNIEELPIIQRRIVKKCHVMGRAVIVATHMLESMVSNPSPTRAEVSDVANAVYEQADAIMLSGETSTGRYPLECVETLDRIALRIERSGGAGFADLAMLSDEKQLTCKSAVVLANSLENAVIVVFTKRGIMARHLARLRPEEPVFAFARDPKVCRSLSLDRGVHPIRFDFSNDPEETMNNAATYLRAKGFVQDGDRMVVVSDLFQREGIVDSILLARVGA
jgi:pyruvate kinase